MIIKTKKISLSFTNYGYPKYFLMILPCRCLSAKSVDGIPLNQ